MSAMAILRQPIGAWYGRNTLQFSRPNSGSTSPTRCL